VRRWWDCCKCYYTIGDCITDDCNHHDDYFDLKQTFGSLYRACSELSEPTSRYPITTIIRDLSETNQQAEALANFRVKYLLHQLAETLENQQDEALAKLRVKYLLN